MQYGLKAEPRRAAGFQAPEYGTFVHYVLEHVLRACRERGGVKEVPEEELRVRRGGQRGGGAALLPVPAYFLRAGLRRGEGPAPGGAECGRHDGQHLRLRGPGGRLGARRAALSAGRGLQDGAQNL